MADSKDRKPVVSIVSLTYNHAPYIRECLDGFLMQKTDFPFEVIIHDDASTDGTSDIIREYAAKYPDIIKPIIQTENQYSKHRNFFKILTDVINHGQGEYVALCEGDDYWTDENKLQKQFDVLESNRNAGLCYTGVKCLKDGAFSDNKTYTKYFKTFNQLLFDGNCIPTLTTVFRKSLFYSFINDILSQIEFPLLMADYPLWLYISLKSDIIPIEAETGVYRELENSASHSDDINKDVAFIKNYYDIRCFFMRKYTDHVSNGLKILNSTLFRQYFSRYVRKNKDYAKFAEDALEHTDYSVLRKLAFLFLLKSRFIAKTIISVK